MKFNILIFSVFLLLSACSSRQVEKPLIKTDEFLEQAKKDIDRTVELGPKAVIETDEFKKAQENKRRNITSEETRSFIGVGTKFENLKQNISINFNNVEIRNVLEAMGELGDINVLIGEEVGGTVSIRLDGVAWDKAFQAVLDLKNFAGDFDTEARVIRVQSPEKLTQQYQFKSQMADTLSKRLALETSVEPVVTEMFKLFYITPAQAKKTLDELFSIGASSAAGGAVQTTSQLRITVEDYTRSILVRGRKQDIDIVDKFVKQIDTVTEQVLIEAFILSANDKFENQLAARLGGVGTGTRTNESSVVSGTAGGAAATASGVTLGSAAGTVIGGAITGAATSGFGILRQIGATALKIELTAMQQDNLTVILSNPKIFTLNNQKATIIQGAERAFETTSSAGTATTFKEAALRMDVTPSIVGDGNVLINVKVNNDSFNSDTTINKMEINTNLLVRDGDIIVIGGIKMDNKNSLLRSTPLLNLPFGKEVTDTTSDLLVYIAPRIIK
jgi:type IV pilus assembly protein PilQ